MQNYKLLITYEGTNYQGFQVQKNGVSIQAVLEKTLSTLFDQKIRVIGSGRTDSGVHALSQVVNFHSKKEFDLEKLRYALNRLLPKDIRVLSLEIVDSKFHSRYSAKSKIYRYHISQEVVLSPFKRTLAWHCIYPLNLEALKKGAAYLIGEHNFRAFANETAAKDKEDFVRTIYRIDLVEEPGGFYLEFEGNGFLYRMVRNMVGALIECARGKRTPEDIQKLLESKDRRLSGVAAPAEGLFLVKVLY